MGFLKETKNVDAPGLCKSVGIASPSQEKQEPRTGKGKAADEVGRTHARTAMASL